jgi:hypothetical protein
MKLRLLTVFTLAATLAVHLAHAVDIHVGFNRDCGPG